MKKQSSVFIWFALVSFFLFMVSDFEKPKESASSTSELNAAYEFHQQAQPSGTRVQAPY